MQMEPTTFVEAVGLIVVPIMLAIAGGMIGSANASKNALKEKEAALDELRAQQTSAFVRENEEEHKKLRQECIELQHAVDRMNRTFGDMRVDIAERYATIIAMRGVENRLGEGLTRLEDKLDQVLLGRR
jgi:uncharacterized protein YukE